MNKLMLSEWQYESREYPEIWGKVITLTHWGGWQWVTVDGQTFRTNSDGDGLWQWMENTNEWKQLSGTCQYSLPQNREKALRKLRRDGYKLALA